MRAETLTSRRQVTRTTAGRFTLELGRLSSSTGPIFLMRTSARPSSRPRHDAQVLLGEGSLRDHRRYLTPVEAAARRSDGILRSGCLVDPTTIPAVSRPPAASTGSPPSTGSWSSRRRSTSTLSAPASRSSYSTCDVGLARDNPTGRSRLSRTPRRRSGASALREQVTRFPGRAVRKPMRSLRPRFPMPQPRPRPRCCPLVLREYDRLPDLDTRPTASSASLAPTLRDDEQNDYVCTAAATSPERDPAACRQRGSHPRVPGA